MPPSAARRPVAAASVSRRGALGLVAAGSLLLLTGCSAEQRRRLLSVEPGRVRLDGDDPVRVAPPVSARERRRRLVLGGAVAARRAYGDAAATTPALLGRYGGAAGVVDAVAVHSAHVDLLGGPGPSSGELLAPVADDGGPVLPPEDRPGAVLGAGGAAALEAALAERGSDDADLALALLHARVSAARAAQAGALRGAGAVPAAFPGGPTPPEVVEALQDVLAQQHRARWTYAVVLAWAGERAGDAEAARRDHTRRVGTMTGLLERLGAVPVGASATYPTDDDGAPVDGPRTAAALALRVEDAVTAVTAALLGVAVTSGDRAWTAAAVTALAEAERARWSWGGVPVALPGG